MAERALTDLRCSIGALTDVGAGHTGRVTIATFSAFAAQTLPGLIGRFRKTGDIVVRVLECNQGEIVEAVRAGVADFGVAYVDGLPETVTGRMLSQEPLYVLLPLAHPLARRRAAVVLWDQIKDATLVSLPPDSYLRRVTDLAAAACGIQLRHPVVVERTASLINHVEAGVGIGILPSGTLPPRPWSGFHVATVDPAVSVSVGVLVPAGRWPSYPASGLLSLIVDDFADDTAPMLRAAAYAATPTAL
jgi:DNA-binding transcriptional LysR family regulator